MKESKEKTKDLRKEKKRKIEKKEKWYLKWIGNFSQKLLL